MVGSTHSKMQNTSKASEDEQQKTDRNFIKRYKQDTLFVWNKKFTYFLLMFD